MLKGIDISHWQEGLNLDVIDCDFVVVKATEGVDFLDPCFKQFMRQAKTLGKCLGFYHYAHPEKNRSRSEAQWFYRNTKEWFNQGIPILDWESVGMAEVEWAKAWLDEIFNTTGVKPMLYASESVINLFDWSSVASASYGLWVAKYRDNERRYNYDMSDARKPVIKYWRFYAMWQWTSKGWLDGYLGNLDCDIFNGDKIAWSKYAGMGDVCIVQEGESISDIASRCHTTVDDICNKNNLLTVGQLLRV